jgi:hypothetical protein
VWGCLECPVCGSHLLLVAPPDQPPQPPPPQQKQLLIIHPYNVGDQPGLAGMGDAAVVIVDNPAMGPEAMGQLRRFLDPARNGGGGSGGGGGQFYMQSVALDGDTSERVLAASLPRLVGGLPAENDTDCVYAAATAAAAGAGAAAGPLLLLDFACSGRGRHLYGRRGGVEVAALAAAAPPTGAAVAGCFVNGEIGPRVCGGAAGWRGGSGGGGPPSETLRQTFTSVFVGLGGGAAASGVR